MYASTRYMPFGDSAVLVEFGNAVRSEINERVLALADSLERKRIEGLEELIPTYRSLLIRYNPLKTSYERLTLLVRDAEEMLDHSDRGMDSKRIEIPIVYGGEYGEDLKCVAASHGLSEERVIGLHCEPEYRVYMIGFVAGFPYLGEVVDEIATPRLENPRLRVAAGSVGIAEKQTGIYPCEAPGGWQIIGRTPLKLFDPSKTPPAFLKAGDTVVFKRITHEEFREFETICLTEER